MKNLNIELLNQSRDTLRMVGSFGMFTLLKVDVRHIRTQGVLENHLIKIPWPV